MKEALVAWKRNEKIELVTVKTELVRDKYKTQSIQQSYFKTLWCSLSQKKSFT